MAPRDKDIKEKIVAAAWELFGEKGYEATTLNDIIARAGIARGTFYYHFNSKETLLNTLSVLLDEKYKEIEETIPADMTAYDKLLYINYYIHSFMGETIDYNLLANQYAGQLLRGGDSNLLDRNRYYFKLLAKFIEEGQKKDEIITSMTSSEIVNYYSMCERALVTDWCMNNGSYSLGEVSKEYMPLLIGMIRGPKG